MTHIALMVEISPFTSHVQTRINGHNVDHFFKFVVGTVITIGQVLRPSNSNGDNAFAQHLFTKILKQ